MIADAWKSIPAKTISNCWTKSGLLFDHTIPTRHTIFPACDSDSEVPDFQSELPDSPQGSSYSDQFLTKLHPNLPKAEHDIIYKEFLNEEDPYNNKYDCDNDGTPSILNARQQVENQVSLGLLNHGIDSMNTDINSDDDDTGTSHNAQFPLVHPPLLPSNSEAIRHFHDISRYLQSLHGSNLITPAGCDIALSVVVEQTTYLATAISWYQESQKKQSKIDNYLERQPTRNPRKIQPAVQTSSRAEKEKKEKLQIGHKATERQAEVKQLMKRSPRLSQPDNIFIHTQRTLKTSTSILPSMTMASDLVRLMRTYFFTRVVCT
ncbi:hypothetical protein HOY80DRAFT_1003176 [Tuber brumale]|nr:hypothetical protein HOY80DRAFT_1003176 [Tuber brumale]